MCELHLYAQSQWHSPAYIAGDREALMRLRHVITLALGDIDYQAKAEFFTNDGEGYQLYIKMMPSEWMENVQLPYTDVEVQDESKFHPSALLTSTLFTES